MIYKNIIRLGVKHSFGLPSNSRNSQINLALAPSFQKRFVTGKIYYDPIGYIRSRIGDRDMVGYGVNGKPEYVDRPDFPFPSILYKETTPDVQALKQKERGDWRLLSIEEKKELYRASFCQTFAEMNAPTGYQFFELFGVTFMTVSAGIWLWIVLAFLAYEEKPKTFRRKYLRAQMRRQLHLRVGHIDGLSSNWDYEKMDWKTKWPWTPENPFTIDPVDDEDDDEYDE